MHRDLEPSVVSITSADTGNSHFGTGFVFALRDGASYLLTCAHVVRDVGRVKKACVCGLDVTVIAVGDQAADDLAVLAVQGLSDVPALPLRPTGRTGDGVRMAGFQVHDKGLLIRPSKVSWGRRWGWSGAGRTDASTPGT